MIKKFTNQLIAAIIAINLTLTGCSVMKNTEYSNAADESAIYNVIYTSIQKEGISNPSDSGSSLVITENGISIAIWPGSSTPAPPIVSGRLFERLKSVANSSDLLIFNFVENLGFNVEIANLSANGASEDAGIFWSNFRKQFPSANGYYAFSHVAFDDDGDRAAVLIAYYCPAFCGGFGGLATFKRIKTQWATDGFYRYWAN